MDKKLIFLDIDGTLTLPGTLVPPESAQRAVREARANGHKVFICTGRNWSMMEPVLVYGFDGAIASAGGYVLCDGQVLYDHPMPHETRDRVIEVLAQAGFNWTLEARDGAYTTWESIRLLRGSTDSEAERWKRAAEKGGPGFRPIEAYEGAPVYKIMFVGKNPSGLEQIERDLGGEFFVCRQSMLHKEDIIHGELINRAFDKGTGVKQICAHLNVPVEDTIGFGDSMNDLAMLETVGIGVCMENGDEDLKKASRIVSPPVEEDGLYRTFVRLGLIEG